MELRAVEAPRRRGIRTLRVPVVAGGDHERIEGLPLAPGQGDFPAAVAAAAAALDRRAEADVSGEPEALDVGLEVFVDLAVIRVGGQVFRHREVLVLHELRVGVDVQRVVGGARAETLVVDAPEPADVRCPLEAGHRQPAVEEGLDDGQSARARADDAGARQGRDGTVRHGPIVA
jgi:hypothetical protein